MNRAVFIARVIAINTSPFQRVIPARGEEEEKQQEEEEDTEEETVQIKTTRICSYAVHVVIRQSIGIFTYSYVFIHITCRLGLPAFLHHIQ